jgi:acid phosphatase (class A)
MQALLLGSRRLVWLGWLMLAACAPVQTPAPPVSPASARSVAGSLRTAELLPAAPKAGTARYEADRQVFLATRTFKDTPRWTLAQQDVDYATPRLLADFSCAMGLPLDAAKLPRLAALVDATSQAADASTGPAKKANQRQRPFVIDQGATCQSTEQLKNSFDYPSGHATRGWAVGLVLAELAPDRASDVLLRSRAFADSRVVCGVHNVSAIDAGAMNGAAVVAVLHASASFQLSLADAKKELDAYRAATAPLPAESCAAEKALIEPTPY